MDSMVSQNSDHDTDLIESRASEKLHQDKSFKNPLNNKLFLKLLTLSSQGLKDEVLSIIDKNPDIIYKSEKKAALLLYWVCCYGNLEFIRGLISRGANLDLAVDSQGRSALQMYTVWKFQYMREIDREKHRIDLREYFILSHKRNETWKRRRDFVHFAVGCGFQPLSSYRIANPPLPPNVKIPCELLDTPRKKKAFQQSKIFSNFSLFRTILEYL